MQQLVSRNHCLAELIGLSGKKADIITNNSVLIWCVSLELVLSLGSGSMTREFHCGCIYFSALVSGSQAISAVPSCRFISNTRLIEVRPFLTEQLLYLKLHLESTAKKPIKFAISAE